MSARIRYIVPASVALLLLVSCGSDDSSGDTSVAVDETVAVDGTVAAVEADATLGLQVNAVDLDAGTAVLVNLGDEPIDLGGHWVCNRPNYAELPDVELAPGATLEIGVGGVTEGGGEVAIYTSDSFSSSDDIVTYVQWGTGGGRSSVAEQGSVWSGDPVEITGAAIVLAGDPGAAEGWE
jgi:hypothetical protein